MNKTLFTLIAFDYLILTFKVKMSAKKYQIFLGTLIFQALFTMVTAKDSGALFFPIGYRQIAVTYTSISRKIN